MNNIVEEYSDFRIKLCNAIKKCTGDDTTVDIKEIMKNNGVVLYGLNIVSSEKKVSPTIYLESYYELYENGRTLSEIVNSIMQVYEANKHVEFEGLDFFCTYEKVKEKLGIKLINRHLNERLLENVPHRDYMDLAIIAVVEVTSGENQLGTVMIHNNHIIMWGVREKDIIEDAIYNAMRNRPPKMERMSDLLFEMVEDCGDETVKKKYEDDIENISNGTEAMYVLSNKAQIFGASVIAYYGILEKISRYIKDDFYILPSSIHEVIIVPQKMCGQDNLNAMIRSVNSEMLEREEILGENAYLYTAKTNRLTIISDAEEI